MFRKWWAPQLLMPWRKGDILEIPVLLDLGMVSYIGHDTYEHMFHLDT